jgi:hypothetical protein
MFKKTISIISISVMLIISSTTTFTSAAQASADRAPDGTLILPSYPLDADAKAAIKEKTEIVKLNMDRKNGKVSKEVVDRAVQSFLKKHRGKTASEDNMATFSTSAYTASGTSGMTPLIQQPQIKSYYCGPATASEILKSKGKNISQSTAASKLMTETFQGTPWYADDTNKYVMQNCLNYHLESTWYYPLSAPNLSNLKSYVQTDVDCGYSVAANVVEMAYGLHLPDHPGNITIYHWVAIDGYKDSGDNLHYAESVYGASSVNWYQNVTYAYYYFPASNFVTLLSDRGIIW